MTPYWESVGVRLYQGDCRAVLAELEAGSVQCVTTSPPYFGLRSYSGGDLEIGAEGDLDAYIGNLVDVFAAVRRVLRDDGTAWINLGDAYAGAGYSNHANTNGARREDGGKQAHCYNSGVRNKNLIGVPHRVAFALQADGWFLRSAIVWHKPNAMPESVRDRPTMDYEMVFLLSKQSTYFYDADAIREPHSDESLARLGRTHHTANHKWIDGPGGQTIANDLSRACHPSGRNKRAVWSIPTQSLRAAHFAAWPEKLVEPMILAGSSQKGACPTCGSPWVRETRREGTGRVYKEGSCPADYRHPRWPQHSGAGSGALSVKTYTLGFRPSCTCPPADPVPCVILDPFAGSGRSGVVARKLGRHFIGIDLSAPYCDLARAQISAVQPPLIGATA